LGHYFFGSEFLNVLSPPSLLYCLVDPRFKSLSFAPKEEADRARQLLTDIHSKLHTEPTNQDSHASERQAKINNLYGIKEEPRGTSRNTLQAYYNEAILEPLLINPLLWWNANKQTYSSIAKIAHCLLARPSTSVPCERLWSEAGNIVNEKRSRLDPDSVSMLTFIEHNLKEFKNYGKPFIWQ
jgi:hypothetical protein